MSNTLLNISMITKESLRELKNQLGFTKGVNRQYDDKFAKTGAKIGDTINIRKPVRFEVTDGAALDIQNIADQSTPLVLDKRKHVGFQFSMQELTLNIDEFSARYIKPAVTALANKVDFDGMGLYKKVWNSVGVPGTPPPDQATALAYALGAGQKLDENACPMDGMRSAVLGPASQAAMVKGLAGLYNQQEAVGKQYEKGRMFDALGFSWKMDQNVNTHTVGALGTVPAVKTTIAANGAATVAVDGASATVTGYFKEGDVITFDTVYAVNPVSKQTLGHLQQFVVTADADTDGSGEIASLSISPAIYASGPYQNVSAFPADGDAILTFGHASSAAGDVSPTNLFYHRDAFVLGCADLELPGGVDMAARASDPESGLSIRIVRQYDINNDVMPCRLDILYGWKAVYPELACRFQG